MTLENQVCSLELAKRLKELGVKQESFCYWITNTNGHNPWLKWRKNVDCPCEFFTTANVKVRYSAFTVAELGEMLPPSVRVNKEFDDKNEKIFYVGLHHGDWRISADTEADARAKMLIYLLENKLITV